MSGKHSVILEAKITAIPSRFRAILDRCLGGWVCGSPVAILRSSSINVFPGLLDLIQQAPEFRSVLLIIAAVLDKLPPEISLPREDDVRRCSWPQDVKLAELED